MAIPSPLRRLLIPLIIATILIVGYLHVSPPNLHQLRHPHNYLQPEPRDVTPTLPVHHARPPTPRPLPPTPNAQREVERLFMLKTIIIFSKSYCPYSAKAKQLLTERYLITPPPYVVELDHHPKGAEIQDLLLERTGRRTVPNVIVAGESIGGWDEINKLQEEGRLGDVLHRLGGERIKRILFVKEPVEVAQN